MDFNNDIFQIFSALDSQNEGFIDKNEFLEKLLNFLPSLDEMEQKDIKQIEQLMKPFDKISLDQFKKIVLEINRLKDDNMQILDDYKSPSHSSGSSDIDEVHYKPKSSFVDDIKPISLSRSSNSSNSEAFLMSPNSATRRAKQLLNNSKESLEKMVNRSFSNDSQNTYSTDYIEDRSEKQIDILYENNSKMKEEISDLTKRLKEEEYKYQAEKDLTKAANERIYLLENIVDDLKLSHKDEVKKLNEDWKNKQVSMEMSVIQVEEEFKIRYTEFEKRLSAACTESENLLIRCEQLNHDNENLLRDVQILRSQAQENETMMMEYKKVASRQVTELQTERDHLELINIQLYNELQTMKHLSPSKTPQPQPENNETDVVLRSRSLSEYISPNKLIRNNHTNEYNTKRQSQVSKAQSGSIESDTNRLVHSLTMENRNLVERIAHLETVVYYQREKLESSNCLSLAAEMEQLNVDELKKALSVEREAVKSLQKYIETLIHKLLVAGHIDVFQQMS